MWESGEWERWKSVSVFGGQVETVVLALVCLTWPGFDWLMLWFIESVCYCNLRLFCCFPECPHWNDFDCCTCVTEIWSEREKTCGRTDITVYTSKISESYLQSSIVAVFKNIPQWCVVLLFLTSVFYLQHVLGLSEEQLLMTLEAPGPHPCSH